MGAKKLWYRRRFLAVTGGTAVLAGCAAEPVENEESPGNDSESDTGSTENNASDDEGVDDAETPDATETGTEDGEPEDNDTDQEGDVDENGSARSDEADQNSSEGGNGTDIEDDEEAEEETEEAEDETEEETEEAEDETEEETEEAEDETEEETEEAEDETEEETEEPPTSEITIEVTDPDGDPISGAAVEGTGDSHPADIPLEFSGGETNSDGIYTTPIYENEYTIEVSHPDYDSTTVEHTHDGETQVTVTLEPIAEEPPTSEITIRVSDSDGDPVSGAAIEGTGDPHPADIPLEFSGGETDSDGIYTTPIYENEYTIEISHPDYDSTTVDHTHDGETELEVTLEPSGTELTIVAVDSTGEPIPGAEVAVYGGGTNSTFGVPTTVDDEGRITGRVGEGEEVEIVVTDGFHPTYAAESRTVTIGSEPMTLEIEALTLESCTVSVEVVDEVGNPIEGADVSVESVPAVVTELFYDDATTDADGTATLETWCGRWSVRARADGYDRNHWNSDDVRGTDTVTIELEAADDD